MPDFSQYLPLSRRPQGDETGASADWSADIAATLSATAELLAGLSPEQWETPSLCAGWRVRDVAGHLVWRLGTPTHDLLRSGVRAWWDNSLRPKRAVDSLSRKAAEAEPVELVAELRRIAAAHAGGVTERGRHGSAELTEAVVHGLDLAHPLGRTLPVSPVALGAVAVRRALLAPTSVTAIVRRRTLVATDAGWRVGRGPELESTAEHIVLFLFGREGFTPTGPRSPAA